MITIKTVIDEIADNIDFPFYSAERRLDVILSCFMEYILKDNGVINSKSRLIKIAPEFPLPLTNKTNNRSECVDFVYLEEYENKEKKILFIEIKTDSLSYKKDQLDNYKSQKWDSIIQSLKSKAVKTKSVYRSKYVKLINVLIDNELVVSKLGRIEYSINSTDTQKSKLLKFHNLKRVINGILPKELPINVVYIGPDIPSNKTIRNINYLFFGKIVKKGAENTENWNTLIEVLKKCS